MTPAAIVAAALAASAVLSIFAFLLSRGQSQAGEMARRLNQYGGDTLAVTAPPRVKTGNAIRDLLEGLTNSLNPLLSRTSHTGKLADDLQKADLKLKSSEWLLAHNRARFAGDGYASVDMELWDPARGLVAYGTQMMFFSFPEGPPPSERRRPAP